VVKAVVCGTTIRGFNSHHSPLKLKITKEKRPLCDLFSFWVF